MKKISITEINLPPVDLNRGALLNLSKENMLTEWLTLWVKSGLENGTLQAGDLIPSKNDLAKYHNVSTGTMQNAVRYAETLGYFKSRQRTGTMIADKNAPKDPVGKKPPTKKDSACASIKQFIVEKKFKKGDVLPALRNIAHKLGTSQNTVRLAFLDLIKEGIVVQNAPNSSKATKILNCDYKDIKIEGKWSQDEIKGETLSCELYSDIKNYIVSHYKINDKIMPNCEFAKMFKVSVRTINDAMKKLNKEKIILSLRGRYGTKYINEPDKILLQGGEKSKFMSKPKGRMDIKNSYSYMWQRALEEIKNYIITTCEAGDKLPSMKDLAKTLDVSSNTIRKAVKELVKEGILICQRGKYGGIYIVEMPAKEDAYTWLALNPKFLVQ